MDITYDPDDAIAEYLESTGEIVHPERLEDTDIQGWDYIPYGGLNNLWIVLEHRKGKRRRYLGWFCVMKDYIELPKVYEHKGLFQGWHVWRSANDNLPA